MEWKPFITFREEVDGEEKYFILQKSFPHNVAIIATQPMANPIAQSTIAGYNLWLVWSGTLRGNMIAVYPEYKDQLVDCFEEMAEWFYNERILKNEKRYAKFKIKKDVPTSSR